jgi:ATP-dependent Clp protease ATP-binding subunit ClpX
MEQRERELRCNFCGKHRTQVKLLIAAVHVSICNECVNVCIQALAQEAPRRDMALQELLPSLSRVPELLIEQDVTEERAYGLY